MSWFGASTEGFRHYPDVPDPTPSAPPMPPEYAAAGHHAGAGDAWDHPHAPRHPSRPPQPPGPGVVLVAAPKLEPQPWVLNLWRSLAANTVGIARIDLRRPTFLSQDEYDSGNILLRRPAGTPPKRGRGRPPTRRPPPAADPYAFGRYADGAYVDPGVPTPPGARRRGWGLGIASFGAPEGEPTGARLKIMRCLQLCQTGQRPGGVGGPRPLVDLGLGLNLDLDSQRLQPVCRIKLQDWLSLKVAPQPVLRMGKAWQVPGLNMVLRARYECPLTNLGDFWQPPARLMVRLEQGVGSGFHLSPGGVEFDERRFALGDSTQVRASALLRFPRQLPIDPEDPDAFKLQVQRLTLKTRW